METGGGLFDEHPELQAAEVSMGTDSDARDKQTPVQLHPDKGEIENHLTFDQLNQIKSSVGSRDRSNLRQDRSPYSLELSYQHYAISQITKLEEDIGRGLKLKTLGTGPNFM